MLLPSFHPVPVNYCVFKMFLFSGKEEPCKGPSGFPAKPRVCTLYCIVIKTGVGTEGKTSHREGVNMYVLIPMPIGGVPAV